MWYQLARGEGFNLDADMYGIAINVDMLIQNMSDLGTLLNLPSELTFEPKRPDTAWEQIAERHELRQTQGQGQGYLKGLINTTETAPYLNLEVSPVPINPPHSPQLQSAVGYLTNLLTPIHTWSINLAKLFLIWEHLENPPTLFIGPTYDTLWRPGRPFTGWKKVITLRVLGSSQTSLGYKATLNYPRGIPY